MSWHLRTLLPGTGFRWPSSLMACPLLSVTCFTSIPPRPTQSPGNFSQPRGHPRMVLPSPEESDVDITPPGITILSCISSLPLVARMVATPTSGLTSQHCSPGCTCLWEGWVEGDRGFHLPLLLYGVKHPRRGGSKLGVRRLKRTGPAVSGAWHGWTKSQHHRD